MRDVMVYRGPDDQGIYLSGPIALAHRRLAIIDLSASGSQPMYNEDRTLALVCNGEIYNYVELRDDLKRKGHVFSSNSDSEVILHQYEEGGEACLQQFNGMFAFALWDGKRRKLFAARDRLGIKPLYYFSDSRRLVLASEIKAILEDGNIRRVPDYQAIADYLYCGKALGGKTVFADIRELDPGRLLVADEGTRRVDVRPYWNVSYNYQHNRTDAAVIDELYDLIDDAVRIHCRSDAALGAHLSGGLDSSTIVGLAARHRDRLKTFSIKFTPGDETEYARAVAAHVNADYLENSPSDLDLATLLPSLMWHMDMPMAVQGGFAYFTASRLAHRHVKVTLTGHGGDELFAGYPAQFEASFGNRAMLDVYMDPDRRPELFELRMPRSSVARGTLGFYRKLQTRFRGKRRCLEDAWVRLHCNDLSYTPEVYSSQLFARLGGYSPRAEYLKPMREIETDQALDRCLYHDLRVYLPSLLHLEDRVSMALSIESRVPLLDHRIVEFLATVPPEQKVRGFQPKYLLRQVASRIVPKNVWQRRDKCNFPVPDRFWASREVRGTTEKILVSPESLDRGIFRPEALKQACDLNALTWQAVNIELWFKLFIDCDPYWLGLARKSEHA
jgi:asparagine synthase (glutamine-hydrolysing)